MSFLAMSGGAVVLGFLHGLGADHLMAIAVLTVDGRTRSVRHARIMRTAVHFACGHAVMLGVGAALALAFGWVLPASAASAAEWVGGLLLVTLGATACWTIWSGRAYGHVHPVTGGARRWHMHVAGHDGHPHGRSSRVPAVLGAVFAVSSLRALMLFAPFGQGLQSLGWPLLLLLVTLFGVGILASMSLFGVLLARIWSLDALDRIGRGAGGALAVASIALGIYWMY